MAYNIRNLAAPYGARIKELPGRFSPALRAACCSGTIPLVPSHSHRKSEFIPFVIYDFFISIFCKTEDSDRAQTNLKKKLSKMNLY